MNNDSLTSDRPSPAAELTPYPPARQASGAHLLEFSDLDPWPDPVDGQLLLDELARTLARFVVLPPDAAEALALWSLHTYAFHLRDVTTYLAIESPEKRCGKTTLLSVLQELVHRPISAANISSPALYRVIQETRPTLLIDEADTLLAGNDELRGILNSGYTRNTAYVVRVGHSARGTGLQPAGTSFQAVSLGTSQPAKEPGRPEPSRAPQLLRFSCWCPKAIAAIGTLPETLADRSIIIRMRRKSAAETSERLRHLDATNLRRCCARFVLDHAHEIASGEPEIPPALNDRAADIWEPLLVLADLAGGHWPANARNAALNLASAAVQHPPIRSLLVDIIVTFHVFEQSRLFSRDIVERLNSLGDRPWAEFKDAKNLSERCLSRHLRPYGIQPKTLWIDDESARGYEKQPFMDAFYRYVPKPERASLLEELGISRPHPPPPTGQPLPAPAQPTAPAS